MDGPCYELAWGCGLAASCVCVEVRMWLAIAFLLDGYNQKNSHLFYFLFLFIWCFVSALNTSCLERVYINFLHLCKLISQPHLERHDPIHPSTVHSLSLVAHKPMHI